MKQISEAVDDWLRPEYKRSELGELVRGKYAATQVEFAELVNLAITCVGEDEKFHFEHHLPGNYRAGRKAGDWTYEIDNANQITLRCWLSEFGSVEEPISNPPSILTPQDREELLSLLAKHVRLLANRVSELNDGSQSGSVARHTHGTVKLGFRPSRSNSPRAPPTNRTISDLK
jgi:hypothetical protein